MRHLAAVAVILLVLPTGLRAQDSDDEWLENCRDGRWGDWGQRARHCEIRETGMKATSQPLHIDPGMNGGVEIIGWNKSDSIAVTARIQVHARTQDDADAIARDIKIEVSGGTVRATGGSGLLGRHQNWSEHAGTAWDSTPRPKMAPPISGFRVTTTRRSNSGRSTARWMSVSR